MIMDTMKKNSKAEMFKALASMSSLQIIDLLKHHDAMSVNELPNALEISQPGVSQHLRVLRNVELVRTERIDKSCSFTA
jgi:DNA-binding transcriptional ArsR family regulator